MRIEPKHEYCPYVLRPLRDLSKRTKEHIFPQGIGGPGGFSFEASTMNNDLGSNIDERLVMNPRITKLREDLNVGSNAIEYDGVSVRDGIRIHKQTKNGIAKEKVVGLPKLETDATTGLMFFGPSQERFLTKFVEDFYDSRGKDVSWDPPEMLADDLIPVRYADDASIVRGLAKIAYASVYECLGDQFLDDPLILDWIQLISADTDEKAFLCGIEYVALKPDAVKYLLPKCEPHQHCVSVANLGPKEPVVVAVSIFGDPALSFCAIASETSGYGHGVLDGKVTICDAKTKQVETMTFVDHCKTDPDVRAMILAHYES